MALTYWWYDGHSVQTGGEQKPIDNEKNSCNSVGEQKIKDKKINMKTIKFITGVFLAIQALIS